MKRVSALICALCLSLTLCGCSSNPELSKKYHQQSYDYYVKGDFSGAEKAASQALKFDKKNTANYYLLALIKQRQKDYEQARKLILKSLEIDPKNPIAYKILGDNEALKGDFATSIEYFKQGQNLAESKELKAKFDVYIQDVINAQNKIFPTKKEAKLNYKIDLDKKVWELAYSGEDNFSTMAEFGLIGEDVVHYKWTKLVTVYYYKPTLKADAAKIKEAFLNNIEAHAKGMNSKVEVKELSSKEGEYIFTWKIASMNQIEMCRVFDGQNGKKFFVKYVHKKPKFTQNESKEILKILNSVSEI